MRNAWLSRNHVVNIGPAEERALLVTLKNNEDSFFLAMPKVDLYDHTPRAMMTTADSVYKKNKWTKSDLKEIKSLVLEHKVWEVKPLPEGKSAMTSKWVRLEKSDHKLKSRLVGRGFI
jgi:hypothetical protein